MDRHEFRGTKCWSNGGNWPSRAIRSTTRLREAGEWVQGPACFFILSSIYPRVWQFSKIVVTRFSRKTFATCAWCRNHWNTFIFWVWRHVLAWCRNQWNWYVSLTTVFNCLSFMVFYSWLTEHEMLMIISLCSCFSLHRQDYSGELLRRQSLKSSGGWLSTWNKAGWIQIASQDFEEVTSQAKVKIVSTFFLVKIWGYCVQVPSLVFAWLRNGAFWLTTSLLSLPPVQILQWSNACF